MGNNQSKFIPEAFCVDSDESPKSFIACIDTIQKRMTVAQEIGEELRRWCSAKKDAGDADDDLGKIIKNCAELLSKLREVDKLIPEAHKATNNDRKRQENGVDQKRSYTLRDKRLKEAIKAQRLIAYVSCAKALMGRKNGDEDFAVARKLLLKVHNIDSSRSDVYTLLYRLHCAGAKRILPDLLHLWTAGLSGKDVKLRSIIALQLSSMFRSGIVALDGDTLELLYKIDEKVLAVFDELRRGGPDRAEDIAQFQISQILFFLQSGKEKDPRFKKTIETLLGRVKTNKGQHGEICFSLAAALEKDGAREDVVNYYNESIECGYTQAEFGLAKYLLGQARLNGEEEDRKEAVTILEKILKNPRGGVSPSRVYHELGYDCYLQGEREQAIAHFRKSVEVSKKPAFDSAHMFSSLYLAQIYYDRGDFNDALEFYKKVFNDSTHCSFLLSQILYGCGHYQEYIKMSQQLIKKQPDRSGEVCFRLANLYNIGNSAVPADPGEALKYLRLAINQGHSESIVYVIQCHLGQKADSAIKEEHIKQLRSHVDGWIRTAEGKDNETQAEQLRLLKKLLAGEQPVRAVKKEAATEEVTIEAEEDAAKEVANTVLPDWVSEAIAEIMPSSDDGSSAQFCEEIKRVSCGEIEDASARIKAITRLIRGRFESVDERSAVSIIEILDSLIRDSAAITIEQKMSVLQAFDKLIKDCCSSLNGGQLLQVFRALRSLSFSPDDLALSDTVKLLSQKLCELVPAMRINRCVYLLASMTRLMPCEHADFKQAQDQLLDRIVKDISEVGDREAFILLHNLAVMHCARSLGDYSAQIEQLIKRCQQGLSDNADVDIRSMTQALLGLSYFHSIKEKSVDSTLLERIRQRVAEQPSTTESQLQKDLTQSVRACFPLTKIEVEACVMGIPVDISLTLGDQTIIVQINGPSHYLRGNGDYRPTAHHALVDHVLRLSGRPVVPLPFYEVPNRWGRSAWVKGKLNAVLACPRSKSAAKAGMFAAPTTTKIAAAEEEVEAKAKAEPPQP